MAKKWIEKIEEKDLGFEKINICRPKFIFFDFSGLKPNTAYWIFFNGIDVTNYCNTSYGLSDYHNSDKSSPLRDPGDRYKKATGFPTELGGPTGKPLYSDSTGSLEGAFFLQSNNTLSFPVGRLQMIAIDISVLNVRKALSYASAIYTADGQYDLYTEVDNGYWKTTPTTVKPSKGTSTNTSPTSSSGSSSTPSGNDKNKNDKNDWATKPVQGPADDKPGNVLSRALGIGNGGAYTKAKNEGKSEKEARDAGGGGGDGTSCFLTTAIVERRGEADDGSTLTKLRKFRDTYMTTTPAMEADVVEYYDIAPKILAKIPHNHSDWKFIEDMVDQSCEHIDAGRHEDAYFCYKNMVNTLKSNWLN